VAILGQCTIWPAPCELQIQVLNATESFDWYKRSAHQELATSFSLAACYLTAGAAKKDQEKRSEVLEDALRSASEKG